MIGAVKTFKAIQKSSGDLITFLDVDDWYLPEKINLQVKIFEEKKDVGLVFTNYYHYNDISKKKKNFKLSNFKQ